jgi:Flp pilus assembly protein TadG
MIFGMKSGRFGNQKGVAVVETALTLLPFLVFLFAIVEAGWFFYVQATLTNAAREGAKWAVLPLTQADALLTEDEVRAKIQPYLATIGVNCPACITLTSETVNTCPSCSEPRDTLMARVSIRVPYTLLTLSWFSHLQFTMRGEGVMRKETSPW